jgi:GPR endopeptidase
VLLYATEILRKEGYFFMLDFRTDLADERKDLYKKANNIENEIDGIEANEEQINNNIKVTRVKIMNEQGENALGKVKGNYVTIDLKNMKYMGEEEIQKASEILCKELKKMIDEYVNKEQEILVVGLGNIYVTPDALGPKVINEIDITRHLLKYVPQYLDKNTRPVSAISPGVLGTTGIETAEILKGIVDNVKPKLVIVIDSLASRSMERISSTIQLADTGIVPGAGVDNARKELTINTLGVPVIALGIPTVVETAVVVNDCLDVFIEKLQEKAESNEYLNKLKEEDNYLEIKEALIPKNFNFIVTPKEIDSLVENMKDVVARGINMSL